MTFQLSKTDQLKYDLLAKGHRYVGTRGNTSAPVCITGEAAGRDEAECGMPFVGASGKEQDRMLSEAGFDLSDVWFTNPYKVRPPDNKLDRLHEIGLPDQQYIDQFLEELNEFKPTFIICAGATSLGILCPQTVAKRTGKAEITKWRGSLLHSDKLSWPHYVLAVHHPAFILRDWSERCVAVLCYAKIKEELDYWKLHHDIQPLPQRELIHSPSFHDAYDYLRRLLNDPLTTPVAIDIENIGIYRGKGKTAERSRLPYTIAFARSAASAISIGLSDYESHQTRLLWHLIDKILRLKRQIGQNYYTHDAPWLEYLGFSPNIRLLDDTLVRHHTLWPEFEHTLQFQTMQYTREPYYKDEGKNWSVKEKAKLKLYNCKDVVVDYEIYERQEEEFSDERKILRPNCYFRNLDEFYHNYAMPLARSFYDINKRGVAVDESARLALRSYIVSELSKSCNTISKTLGKPCVPQAGKKQKLPEGTINLSSGKQVIDVCKSLKMKVPTKRRANNKHTESVDEESLNTLFAETGHPFLKEMLRVRELNKVLGTYVDTKLENNILYSAYFVTGTVTGRRSSRANFLGLGSNGQNQPKHSDLGKRYRACIVARPNKIFVSCDQVQAEDWIVQGIVADQSGDRHGLDELLQGVDRHKKLAAFIFSKPEDQCGKDTPERFMGKKTRHAGNYDMEAFRFAAELAKEGYTFPFSHCEFLLSKFHDYDRGIRGVFHKYVKDTLSATYKLVTPIGRVRQFFSLRPYADNKKIFKEGYAQIPQSTVGDNTGLAILWLEQNYPGYVVMDGHDAVVLEIDNNLDSVTTAITWLRQAFHRTISFPNGTSFEIPIEVEVGYNLGSFNKKTGENPRGMRGIDISCAASIQAGLTNLLQPTNQLANPQVAICSGQPQVLSPER